MIVEASQTTTFKGQIDEAADSPKQPEMEDQAEVAETFASAPPYTNLADDEPDEFIIEVSEPSGCHQTDNKVTFWKLFVLLLLMYFLGAALGWLAARHNKN